MSILKEKKSCSGIGIDARVEVVEKHSGSEADMKQEGEGWRK